MCSSWGVFLMICFLLHGFTSAQLDVPTLIPPLNFNPASDASTLDKAMSGLGTDEAAIISILCYRSFEQRALITSSYNSRFGNLISDLNSELSGDFKVLSIMLTYDKSTFLAIEIHEVMAGAGTDEASLTEILTSRTNQELEGLRNSYATYYGTPLVADLEAETSGSLRDLLTRMALGSRDESTDVNMTLVSNDVLALYNAGEGNAFGTNEDVFVDIFSSRNWPHMREISNQYGAVYGPLDSAIVSEFNSATGNALISILHYSQNKAAYFAARFYSSIAGAGTADRDLKRLTVSRCETDLGNIKVEYEKIYRVPLSTAVSGDTSGDYRSALLALIG